jgi:hypothetical protein
VVYPAGLIRFDGHRWQGFEPRPPYREVPDSRSFRAARDGTDLGSSDQSNLESSLSGLIVDCHVLRSEFGRCQIPEA